MADLYKRVVQAGRGRIVLALVIILIIIIGILAIGIYLVDHPEKPRFTVVAASVYGLNVSTTQPPFVSASMQFALMTRNPNKRVHACFDRLTAYIVYKGQPLTQPVGLPPLNLGERQWVTMAPVIGSGQPVEVAEQVVNGIEGDEGYGVMGLRVLVIGRLRWRAGGVFWSHHRLSVTCDVLMGLRQGEVGQVQLLATPPCKVDA